MTGKEFIEKFLPLDCDMYRLAFSLTGSGQDAEDIVQELFMKLWKSLDSLDSVKSPRAYCLTLTRNLCIDLLRRRKRVHAESIDGQADIGSGPDAETGFILKERIAALAGRIGKLPERQRKILTMKVLEGLSNKEISERTGLSDLTVRVTLSLARKSIREWDGK